MLAKHPSTLRSPQKMDLNVVFSCPSCVSLARSVSTNLRALTPALSGPGSNSASSEKPSLTTCRKSFISVYLMFFVFLLIISKGLASLCAVSLPEDRRGRPVMLAAVSPSVEQVLVNILMNWNEMNKQIRSMDGPRGMWQTLPLSVITVTLLKRERGGEERVS